MFDIITHQTPSNRGSARERACTKFDCIMTRKYSFPVPVYLVIRRSQIKVVTETSTSRISALR